VKGCDSPVALTSPPDGGLHLAFTREPHDQDTFLLVIFIPLTPFAFAEKPPEYFDKSAIERAQKHLDEIEAERANAAQIATTQQAKEDNQPQTEKQKLLKQLTDSILFEENHSKGFYDNLRWKRDARARLYDLPDERITTLMKELKNQTLEYQKKLDDFQKLPKTNPDDPFMSPKSAATIFMNDCIDRGYFSVASFIGYGIQTGQGFIIYNPQPDPQTMDDQSVSLQGGFDVEYTTAGGFIRQGRVSIITSRTNDWKWFPSVLMMGDQQIHISDKVRRAWENTPSPVLQPPKPFLFSMD